MKEKVEKIILKLVFLASLFLAINFIVRITTLSYCVVEDSILGGKFCTWTYVLTRDGQFKYSVAIFILALFVMDFFKKRNTAK